MWIQQPSSTKARERSFKVGISCRMDLLKESSKSVTDFPVPQNLTVNRPNLLPHETTRLWREPIRNTSRLNWEKMTLKKPSCVVSLHVFELCMINKAYFQAVDLADNPSIKHQIMFSYFTSRPVSEWLVKYHVLLKQIGNLLVVY